MFVYWTYSKTDTGIQIYTYTYTFIQNTVAASIASWTLSIDMTSTPWSRAKSYTWAEFPKFACLDNNKILAKLAKLQTKTALDLTKRGNIHCRSILFAFEDKWSYCDWLLLSRRDPTSSKHFRSRDGKEGVKVEMLSDKQYPLEDTHRPMRNTRRKSEESAVTR